MSYKPKDVIVTIGGKELNFGADEVALQQLTSPCFEPIVIDECFKRDFDGKLINWDLSTKAVMVIDNPNMHMHAYSDDSKESIPEQFKRLFHCDFGDKNAK